MQDAFNWAYREFETYNSRALAAPQLIAFNDELAKFLNTKFQGISAAFSREVERTKMPREKILSNLNAGFTNLGNTAVAIGTVLAPVTHGISAGIATLGLAVTIITTTVDKAIAKHYDALAYARYDSILNYFRGGIFAADMKNLNFAAELTNQFQQQISRCTVEGAIQLANIFGESFYKLFSLVLASSILIGKIDIKMNDLTDIISLCDKKIELQTGTISTVKASDLIGKAGICYFDNINDRYCYESVKAENSDEIIMNPWQCGYIYFDSKEKFNQYKESLNKFFQNKKLNISFIPNSENIYSPYKQDIVPIGDLISQTLPIERIKILERKLENATSEITELKNSLNIANEKIERLEQRLELITLQLDNSSVNNISSNNRSIAPPYSPSFYRRN